MDSWGGCASEGSEGESLSDLLRSWRGRSDPRAFPGLARPGRRSVGLSQRDVARLTGVSDRWYRSLERGREAKYSPDFLDRLSSVLHLSSAERHALYLKALGRPPALAQLAFGELDDELLQQFLDSQSPNPAYASDLSWNMVGANEPFHNWFPWSADSANLVRYTFFHPEARDRLVNWREEWARKLIGQVRFARIQYPENEALFVLEREILEGSADARELWGRREVYEHDHGDLRKLKLPVHHNREVTVRIVALTPMRSPWLRVVVLMRAGGDAAGV